MADRADRVWRPNAAIVAEPIYGPHFKDLARQWCLLYADEESLGGVPSAIWPAEIACREHEHGHQLNIGRPPDVELIGIDRLYEGS